MKKFILLLLFFAAKNIISQNGLSTYSTSITGSVSPISETTIFIDNAGNKWIGFFNGSSGSAAAFGVYTNSISTWTFWNKTTTPVLPGNRTNCFAQDNSGNIWIGMSGGLVKYDGTSFTLYTTTNGLPHNNIQCLEYSNNMLYIGTYGGLSRYDGTTFTNYSLSPLISILDIKAETPTTIWLTSANYLAKLSFNSSYTSSSYTTAATTSTAISLHSLYIDATGNKWIGALDQVIKYDNTGFTYFETMYPNFKGAQFYMPNSLCKGPNNGVLLVGDYNNPNSRCLVELLPGGNYNLYNFPASSLIGTSVVRETSGKIFMTGAVTSSTTGITAKMHSFDYSNYSVYGAFGLGAGGGVNNDNFKYLDINRVKAGMTNRGDMHWEVGGNGQPAYEVPVGALAVDWGATADYASSLWIGGLDPSNQLHTAAQMYRETGNDFWPGPLDTTNAFIDTVTTVNYDKIWKVSTDDINTFLYQFSLGNVPLTYTPTPDILSWPAKGTGNKSRNLAPFVDVNNNGIYDPLAGGDYPKIKGDQTLYFIFNDNLGSHSQTGGLPFGIEVHTMAYAYGCPDVLNGRTELAYTTFYDYKIYNRSSTNYHDVYCGIWSDADLGNYLDDYIGSSISDNLGFIYNSDDFDDVPAGGGGWYSAYPPAIGRTVLKGPLAPVNDLIDNDNDSIVDELGEECLMNVFDYFNNNIGAFPTPTKGPTTKYHYYNFLQGKLKDSTNFTCGAYGMSGTIPTKFVYPQNNYLGNPCGSWTEYSTPNFAGDRRYIISSGPFSLAAKGMVELEYAQVWSVDSSATSNIHIASVNKLINDTKKVRSFYKSGTTSCVGKAIGVKENELKDNLLIYPNPANSVLNIRSENSLGKSVISVTDILGNTIIETKNNDLYNASINIEQLSSGVYLLNIRSEKGLVVKKFVKE